MVLLFRPRGPRVFLRPWRASKEWRRKVGTGVDSRALDAIWPEIPRAFRTASVTAACDGLSCMTDVVRVDFEQALDGNVPWHRRRYKSVCGLAPRWEVVLTKKNGAKEVLNAEFGNRGANRDAYVLDIPRIMEIDKTSDQESQNELEVRHHEEIIARTGAKVLPEILGSGRSSVVGGEFCWVILERAALTMSDMMLH